MSKCGMASQRVLQDWCRVMCANYPSVDIKNMSASFRDGLAFCAIIHKHRPDLIDFSSLSKDNAYHNNKLAFDVAETKLGIPALLDPQDMVSTEVPDCLSVITYLSHYYYYFNKKACGPARSPHLSVLNNLTKSRSSDGLKRLKNLTDLETSGEDHFSNTRPQKVCSLCFKPVHLIQRHLIDGKVYHRSCFRCKVCHSTLLADSYTRGSDTGSLICTYHTVDGKSTYINLSQQPGSSDNQPESKFQEVFFSLAGLAITSVPRYTKKPESQVRLVSRTTEADERERQERSREIKNRESPVGPPRLPQPSVKDKMVKGEGSRPVPAPRRMLDSSGVPVPAPRIKTSQTMISSPAAGSSSSPSKSPPTSSHINSPKVQTNHPWMTIVHPGPWTQLPPAPAPVPAPRSKSVSNLRVSWNRPKMPPLNPFEEEEEEEDNQREAAQQESGDQTVAVVCSENGGNTDAENPNISSEENKMKPPEKPILTKKSGFRDGGGDTARDSEKEMSGVTNKVEASSEPCGDVCQIGSSAVSKAAPRLDKSSEATQSHVLPRSLSVPSIPSDLTPSVPAGLKEANEGVTSEKNKLACKENPFDRKPALTKSTTFQDLSSSRGPAPGHGFPLIKRKVQTDQCVSTEDLQVQMREVDRHLEALEQKGVELERNLRDCKNDKEEEHMLTEWFYLVHERHVLTRQDTELVYLTKQQKLEDRQADVEYELRCLLNKPECDWNQEDRGREQQLMNELVDIIEQRNQIISCLDQDRQREREEDLLWEDMKKNKCSQKEGPKELKKSKGKFKPTKVFKMLNHKTESSKDSPHKKS
ncbi:MICAL-like protein 1 isoform X2 [Amphiprion ocellaris]|uniref:MICAL-like protein 1 isoform X2 n=1 Tax=Amphiprion ocellaris TaxID=80972 RepID=UPI002411386F|nr:MICAL-like protein 1 isoform X2 [Amphiprion ocellaris]